MPDQQSTDGDVPIHLDLTVLSSAPLLAASLFAMRATGRVACFSWHDLYTSVWLPAGIVPDWTCGDEELAADAFHADCHDSIRGLVPHSARLDEPIAATGLLLAAITEGFVTHAPHYDVRWETEDLFSRPESVLEGLRSWNGTLSDYLRQPWVESPAEPGRLQRLLLGPLEKAATKFPRPAVDADYAEALRSLGRDYFSSGNEHGSGFYLDAASGPSFEKRILRSAMQGIGLTLDGSGEGLSRNRALRRILAEAGSPTLPVAERQVEVMAPLTSAFGALGDLTTISSALRIIDDANYVESIARVLSGQRESVGHFLSGEAERSLPQPVRFVASLTKFTLRRRRRRRRRRHRPWP